MYKSEGILQYFYSNNYKLWLLLDDSIGDYYRSLIPHCNNKPKYPTHISVFRGEEIPNLNKWGLYENKIVEFEYGNTVYNNDTYWWLEAKCPELEKIRVELGLSSTDDITCSPDKRHSWHITIANNK